LRKYTGRNKNIYELMNVLENKYIERGYITTKVGLNIEVKYPFLFQKEK